MRVLRWILQVERDYQLKIDHQLTQSRDFANLPKVGFAPLYLASRLRILRWAIRYAGLWIPDALNVTLALVLEPGDTFLDIGANVGWVTEKASWLVGSRGEVHSFEPSPSTVCYLRRRVSSLGLKNVIVNQFALGKTPGVAVLHEFSENFGGSSSLALGANTAPGQHLAAETPIEIQTLDAYVKSRAIDNIRMMKIDVQGAEMQVLQGASELFSDQHPILFVEIEQGASVAFGYTAKDLLETIIGLGYQMYSWRNEGLTPVYSEDDIPPGGHDDVICLQVDDPFHALVLSRLRDLASCRDGFLVQVFFGPSRS